MGVTISREIAKGSPEDADRRDMTNTQTPELQSNCQPTWCPFCECANDEHGECNDRCDASQEIQ